MSDDGTCDLQQLTTSGLAYVRRQTGTIGFTALPDGIHHWAWTPSGTVEWFSPDADPPPDASTIASASPGPTADDGCLGMGADPSTACLLTDGASVLGYVTSTGGTNAYQFSVPNSEHVLAQLTDLPADYDLYLVDSSSQIVDQSVQDGVVSELINSDLGPGVYYLYVHVDPARDYDPYDPYRLNLSLSPSTAQPAPEPTDPAVAGGT